MHMLAHNFALQLKQEISKDANKPEQYGEHVKYQKIFLGKTDGGENVTVKEIVCGTFVKYINNNGFSCVPEDDVFGQKAQCLSDFSYEKSGGKLMVVNIQGSGCHLYDPEIATANLYEGSQFLFCTGDLAHVAINNFISNHKCGRFCNLASLSLLSA